MSFEKKFKFNIIRSHRRTCAIQISQYGEVTVRAPNRLSDRKIHFFVKKHQDWIIKKITDLNKNPKKILKYFHGEEHYYLGKPYLLDLKTGSEEIVGVSDTYLMIITKTPSTPGVTKTLLYDWYLEQAQKIFWERFEACCIIASFHGIEEQPSMRIKQLKSRWGSCSSKKNINLNLELIKAPIECIDQVILHELCHLRHMNHGRNFYHLLTQMMPDWKQHKITLKKVSRNF